MHTIDFASCKSINTLLHVIQKTKQNLSNFTFSGHNRSVNQIFHALGECAQLSHLEVKKFYFLSDYSTQIDFGCNSGLLKILANCTKLNSLVLWLCMYLTERIVKSIGQLSTSLSQLTIKQGGVSPMEDLNYSNLGDLKFVFPHHKVLNLSSEQSVVNCLVTPHDNTKPVLRLLLL